MNTQIQNHNHPPAPEGSEALMMQGKNQAAMRFLVMQAKAEDTSAFQAGRFYGACEALCMAGVISAEQWQELDDLAGKEHKHY